MGVCGRRIVAIYLGLNLEKGFSHSNGVQLSTVIGDGRALHCKSSHINGDTGETEEE